MKLFGWISPAAARELARRSYNVGYDTGLAAGRVEALQGAITDAVFRRLGIVRPGRPTKPPSEQLRIPEKAN
jgi:hypothetical protein